MKWIIQLLLVFITSIYFLNLLLVRLGCQNNFCDCWSLWAGGGGSSSKTSTRCQCIAIVGWRHHSSAAHLIPMSNYQSALNCSFISSCWVCVTRLNWSRCHLWGWLFWVQGTMAYCYRRHKQHGLCVGTRLSCIKTAVGLILCIVCRRCGQLVTYAGWTKHVKWQCETVPTLHNSDICCSHSIRADSNLDTASS